ncbi:MAG TPA: protein kinase [Gemmataceae bacterium]|nr:protein kinase [Gemmataceae bacterium]
MTNPPSNLLQEYPVDPLTGDEECLIEHLTQEMVSRWRQGERPVAEEYFRLHPRLWHYPEAALELVYEEIHLRQEAGQEVRVEDLLDRFPQWHRQVKALLECHHLLAPGLAAPLFPEPGETLGEFRLLSELGRGTTGRVFLAAQPTLADRLVVLKLGPQAGREHLSLARLQHTHIVPLHSVHEFPARRLCALCLPHFGGTTLDRLLKAMQGRPPGQRRGQHIGEALRDTSLAGSVAVPVEGPCWRFLARVSYVQAVCWMGACLADALHYAHERNLLHLDLKPSNVLLASDGQPMLLDFHLARAPISADSPPPLWLGGTPDYMAPEHRAALNAVAQQQPVALAVEVGADIYALGVLLYELLGGKLPSRVEEPTRSLRRLNPRVSVGLADVVARCLNPVSANRYPTAFALASDLRRHLADLPLQGVANRSLFERWGKWRRRRRYALPMLGLAFAGLAGIGLALYYVSRQAHKAEDSLRNGQVHLAQHWYGEALDGLKSGMALIEDLPFYPDLKQQLHDRMRKAERGQAVQELHLLSERLRPLYSATVLPEAEAGIAEVRCRSIWRQRNAIVQRLGVPPEFELERQVRADLLDLLILGMHLQVRLAPSNEVASARRQTLEIFDEAEALLGPSCVLCRERQIHARALGLTNVAEAAARQAAVLLPHTSWEHCAVGLVHFRAGDFRRASEEMQHALEQEPNSLWPNFYRGSCAYRLGQFEEASTAFSVCVALAPQCAWCYANRGLAYGERGQLDRALRDYDVALGIDPNLSSALLCRSVLYSRQKRYAEALDDLRRASKLGTGEAVISYHRALIHLARQERADAVMNLRLALRHDPGHAQAEALLNQLLQAR